MSSSHTYDRRSARSNNLAESPPGRSSIRHDAQEAAILQALLRKARESADLRQQDLAERLKVPQSFVSKYESGERRLDLLELRHVCLALNIRLRDFVTALEKRLDGSN